MTNTRTLGLAVALMAVSSASVFAALPGVKANATITVAASHSVGGFLVKMADTESLAANGIYYGDILNPPGYNPEVTGANYYVRKETVTSTETYEVVGEDEQVTTESRAKTSNVDERTRVVTQRLSNAQIIKALMDREFIPASSLAGWKLVVIFPADRPDSTIEKPALIFVEKGAEIHYVGRQVIWHGERNVEPTRDDAITLEFGNSAETFNYKGSVVYNYENGDEGGYQEIHTPTSESFSGRIRTWVDIFPGYWDDEDFIVQPTSYFFSGTSTFAGGYNKANNLYITRSVNLTGGFGSAYADDERVANGISAGGFSIRGAKVIADITPYLDALPESLAVLKNNILASYQTEDL
jgi:hypothetical protein